MIWFVLGKKFLPKANRVMWIAQQTILTHFSIINRKKKQNDRQENNKINLRVSFFWLTYLLAIFILIVTMVIRTFRNIHKQADRS